MCSQDAKPWKPALKAQLKDKHGFFLSPANELKELSQYATQVFAAHPKLPEHTGSMPQLEPAKLARQKASIKPGKAVPKGSALAAAWKLCARPVSQALARCCDSLDTRQHLDDGLTRAADLCLTPKPGKSADKPSQLRPLGILCPDAKGLAGAAKELWSRSPCPTCGRCLSSPTSQDAASPTPRVGSYLREVRELCCTANPSRMELQRAS